VLRVWIPIDSKKNCLTIRQSTITKEHQLSRTSILVCSVFSAASITLAPGTSAHALPGSHFGWGQGQDGWGHCYEYASSGGVLNEGQPVSDSFCGRVVFRWGQGQDGWTHCYEYGGPYVINAGQPVANNFCGG
jgi:hypothetical protein